MVVVAATVDVVGGVVVVVVVVVVVLVVVGAVALGWVVGLGGAVVVVAGTVTRAVVVVVSAGGTVGVGGGDGFGIGRPESSAATTSAMNAARARVAARFRCTASTYDAESLAAAVFAHSARTHNRWPLHHCRSALV